MKAIAILVAIVSAHGQSTLRFEVASVKLDRACATGAGRGGSGPSPGRLDLKCLTLENLIRAAYGTFANGNTPSLARIQVIGGPAWLTSDYYDIAGKTAGIVPLTQMAGPMLRALLEDRFRLKLHRETKPSTVYALTVSKGGTKMKLVPEGSCIPFDVNHPPSKPAAGEPAPNVCGRQSTTRNGEHFVVDQRGVTMDEFAKSYLSSLPQMDLPVIDNTGLTGRFDFRLEYSGPGASDSEAISIFEAVQQLGLNLAPAKGGVEVLVIDHVERPSAN